MIVRDENINDQLMDEHKQKSNYGSEAKDKYYSEVDAMLERFKG